MTRMVATRGLGLGFGSHCVNSNNPKQCQSRRSAESDLCYLANQLPLSLALGSLHQGSLYCYQLRIIIKVKIEFQVNYLEWEGKLLPESAWCSIPFNEVTCKMSLFSLTRLPTPKSMEKINLGQVIFIQDYLDIRPIFPLMRKFVFILYSFVSFPPSKYPFIMRSAPFILFKRLPFPPFKSKIVLV